MQEVIFFYIFIYGDVKKAQSVLKSFFYTPVLLEREVDFTGLGCSSRIQIHFFHSQCVCRLCSGRFANDGGGEVPFC